MTFDQVKRPFNHYDDRDNPDGAIGHVSRDQMRQCFLVNIFLIYSYCNNYLQIIVFSTSLIFTFEYVFIFLQDLGILLSALELSSLEDHYNDSISFNYFSLINDLMNEAHREEAYQRAIEISQRTSVNI